MVTSKTKSKSKKTEKKKTLKKSNVKKKTKVVKKKVVKKAVNKELIDNYKKPILVSKTIPPTYKPKIGFKDVKTSEKPMTDVPFNIEKPLKKGIDYVSLALSLIIAMLVSTLIFLILGNMDHLIKVAISVAAFVIFTVGILQLLSKD
ncbi:hypothetical protein KO465_05675 [Candidatus Micrarchaeota archaeon]|nr:hypothetical protein [Candidatus Micrarchaeota archaeon]